MKTYRQSILCMRCAKPFVPGRVGNRHKGLFCSRVCSSKWKHETALVVNPCLGCGKYFESLKKDKRKYCSYECSVRRGTNNYAWKGGKAKISCALCGKEFSAYKCPTTNPQYCSRACKGKAATAANAGSNNPNWKGGKPEPCAVCGKNVWITPKRTGTTVYCSKECFIVGEFKDRKAKRWSHGNRWASASKKSGKRADLNNQFFRSSWEANYARYLNVLKARGEIVSWEFEAVTFEFHKIKRGTRFYTPDFKVTMPCGAVEYHEVKGYRHPKGETALKRMAKYYPELTIKVIDKDVYKAIAKTAKTIIPGWE